MSWTPQRLDPPRIIQRSNYQQFRWRRRTARFWRVACIYDDEPSSPGSGLIAADRAQCDGATVGPYTTESEQRLGNTVFTTEVKRRLR